MRIPETGSEIPGFLKSLIDNSRHTTHDYHGKPHVVDEVDDVRFSISFPSDSPKSEAEFGLAGRTNLTTLDRVKFEDRMAEAA